MKNYIYSYLFVICLSFTTSVLFAEDKNDSPNIDELKAKVAASKETQENQKKIDQQLIETLRAAKENQQKMELELIEELKAAKQTCIEKHIASLSEIDQLLEALGASEKNNIKLPNLNFAIAEADEPGLHSWKAAHALCAAKGPGWTLPDKNELKAISWYKHVIRNAYPASALHTELYDTPSYWASNQEGLNRNAYVDKDFIADPNIALRVRCIKRR